MMALRTLQLLWRCGFTWVRSQIELFQNQVIAVLVNAIFAMPNLQWGPSHEIDHLELFAGDCAVTRGEFQDRM